MNGVFQVYLGSITLKVNFDFCSFSKMQHGFELVKRIEWQTEVNLLTACKMLCELSNCCWKVYRLALDSLLYYKFLLVCAAVCRL